MFQIMGWNRPKREKRENGRPASATSGLMRHMEIPLLAKQTSKEKRR
jgi:hypothetical protein